MCSVNSDGTLTPAGFPHSDIAGSSLACSSPTLFAAYHVLLRLLVPRHPPYALISLTFFRLRWSFLMHIVSAFFHLYNFQRSFGGDERNRTADPLLARQVLSQLSYTPVILVGLDGLEPSTSRLSGVRSNHLSYAPVFKFLQN